MEFSGKTTNKVIIESFVDKTCAEAWKNSNGVRIWMFIYFIMGFYRASCSFSLKSDSVLVDKDVRYALLVKE